MTSLKSKPGKQACSILEPTIHKACVLKIDFPPLEASNMYHECAYRIKHCSNHKTIIVEKNPTIIRVSDMRLRHASCVGESIIQI